MRSPLAAAAGLTVAILLLATLLALTPAVQRWNGDIRLFEHYAGLTFSGYLGQTAFLSWYPPFALMPLGLPLLVGTGPMYVLALAAEMSVVAGTGLLVIRRFGERLGASSGSGAVYAALALALTVIVAWRYDIVPAVMSLAALAWLACGWWLLAGAALGVAVGLKVYAAALIPVFLLWAVRRSGPHAAILVTAGAAVAGSFAVGAYFLFPGASPFELLAFTAGRPLHVESLPGAVIALLASMGVGSMSLIYDSGSFNVITPVATPTIDALRLAQPIILLSTLLVAGAAIARPDKPSPQLLVTASAAVLLALIVSNRVLSPQYLIWLIPFAALAGGRLRWLLAGAVGLTTIVFPWLYSILIEGHPLPLLLVLLRNALLVGAWIVAVGALARLSIGQRGIGQAATTGVTA